jgi:hypothetical protein
MEYTALSFEKVAAIIEQERVNLTEIEIVELKNKLRKAFNVVVDYDQSIPELVKRLRFLADSTSYYVPNIVCSSQVFHGKIPVEIYLFNFGYKITNELAAREMDKLGFRSVSIKELIALDMGYPDLKFHNPIVGSECSDGKHIRVPYLWREASIGIAFSYDSNWGQECRFAAIKK